MDSLRRFLIALLACAALLFGWTADAAPRPARNGESVLQPLRVDLDAGEYAAFRFDPKKKEYRVLRLPPVAPDLHPAAAAAVRRAPAWLRDRLAAQLGALGKDQIRVSRMPGRVGVVGDRLLVRDAEDRVREYSAEGLELRKTYRNAAGGAGSENSPVLFDIDRDGLPDEVRVAEDGGVVYRPSRGPIAGRKRAALEFHHDARRFFARKVGSAIRPVFYDDSLYLGELDSMLSQFPRIGQRWASEPIILSSEWLFTAPAVGDLDGDGRPEVVIGGESGRFRIVAGSETSLFAGMDVGDFSSPCLVDFDGDGDLDLLSGNGEGKVILIPNQGTARKPHFPQVSTPGALAAIDVGDSSALACGDVNGDAQADLIVGNQAGELTLFLGPGFKKIDGAFDGLDVGELATPAFYGNDLIVGNLDGEVLLYELSMVNGKLRFTERDSWSFTPDQDAKSIEAYYDRRYFREFKPVLGEIDPECRKAYVELLARAPANLVDEVAFAIANTPIEVLRAMVRLDQADLLVENARAIYDLDARLDYVRIEERDGYTTLVYRTADGGEIAAPRDVYYWWVVHPRILYEIPLKVDASYWDKSATDRGQTDSEWWKTKPEGDIHDPKGKGVFWRSGLAADKRFGVTLEELVADAATLEDALREIHDFLANNSDGAAVMRFGYETQDLQPWQIYAKHYGSCGEHSIIGAACARTMLLPMSVVSNRGEDHQWNEYWGTDGRWHHVDFCGKRNIDQPWGSTEGREHQGKTVSSVTRWRGDDFLDATTTSVHSPEPDYTLRGTGYTDTAAVTIRVADPRDRPVDGALIIVRSHWDNRNMVTVWGYTDGDGKARFDLGYEPNGGYTIEALTPLGSAGLTNFPVVENETYEILLTTPKSKPVFATEERFTSLPAGADGADLLTAKIDRAFLTPPNFITSGRYRIGSWLTENAGYRGTRTHEVPVGAGDLLELLVFTPEEYARFSRGDLCAPLIRRPLSAGSRIGFAKGLDRDHVVVISNLNALFLSASVVVAPKPGAVPEAKAPKVTWRRKGDGVSVRSGESVEIAGAVSPAREVEDVVIRCTAWESDLERPAVFDRKSGRFSFELKTGEGGPLPPGPYTLTAIARGRGGKDGVSTARPITIAPARTFKNQVIRQDDPDDPLAGASWVLGPFVLHAGERFLLIRTKSLTTGFDMDMYLYFDRNGNGRLDGKGEQIASGTSPTANERIYLKAPRAGTYWLHCRGWQVEGDQALLDVEVYPLGEIRGVVDVAPAGRGQARPAAVTANFRRFAAIDQASVQILLDGVDVTHRSEVTQDGATLPLDPALPTDVEHRISLRAKHASGREEIHEWTFLTDTRAPTLEILAAPETPSANGMITIEARATDEGPRPTVTARRADGKSKRLTPVKQRPGTFRVKLDTGAWGPGEHFILITARDAVGNETDQVIRIVR